MRLKTLLGCIAGASLMACLSFAQTPTLATWKSFTSDTGFSVRYPDNWQRKGISNDRLTILSSKGGAEGVIIKRGQAMITVMEASEHASSTLPQVMKNYSRGVVILSKRDVINTSAVGQTCHVLREIVSKEAIVPPEDMPRPVPYIINTELFCKEDGHIYVTVLRNFEGDKNQKSYQAVALKMAKSLRIDE